MTKSILVTRPDHDPVTRYLCVWSEQIITLAKSKGFITYDLKGSKSRRSSFQSYMVAKRPKFLFLNGHGDTETIAGHDNDPLLDMTDMTSNMKGTIIYARSCDAGKALGPHLVNRGAQSFIGYKRKFICGYSPDKILKPHQDPIACLFLEPSNLVASTLIKGYTTLKAHHRSRDAMYRNFRKMISSASSYEERYAARWLWADMNSQVLLGDHEGKI